jgi:hypothetical protein
MNDTAQQHYVYEQDGIIEITCVMPPDGRHTMPPDGRHTARFNDPIAALQYNEWLDIIETQESFLIRARGC